MKFLLDILASLFGLLRGRQDAANAPDIKENKKAVLEQAEKDKDAEALAKVDEGDLEEARRRAAE